MRVTMMLADAADTPANGKLYILGGGWSLTGPAPTRFAIAMIIEVPWVETNRKHRLKVDVITADGHPVLIDTLEGKQPFPSIEGEFEVGRPPGITPGSPLNIPMALNVGPIQLPHNDRFVIRCSINGKSNDDWTIAFSTRPEGAQTPQQM